MVQITIHDLSATMTRQFLAVPNSKSWTDAILWYCYFPLGSQLWG